MFRAIRMMLRFMAMMAVLALVAALLAPPSPTNSPYLSALSSLSSGSALAAPPNCPKTFCQADECLSTRHATYCGGGPIGGCRTFHC
ncbi:MAG TPA: hypothetical protein VKL61_09460 [Candidatus Polarisedimenticolia bacterium]|nr:hypothetical protein [Candidatus Polarisedimenticolia bacterium]